MNVRDWLNSVYANAYPYGVSHEAMNIYAAMQNPTQTIPGYGTNPVTGAGEGGSAPTIAFNPSFLQMLQPAINSYAQQQGLPLPSGAQTFQVAGQPQPPDYSAWQARMGNPAPRAQLPAPTSQVPISGNAGAINPLPSFASILNPQPGNGVATAGLPGQIANAIPSYLRR